MPLTVITGPPCSGKTRWVMERATATDLVIDFDRLAVALAGPGADGHDHPPHIRDAAYRARSAAIHAALDLAPTTTVYLIHTMPSDAMWQRYTEADAHVIRLDPGRTVVESRCRAERAPSMLAVVGKWYAQADRQAALAEAASLPVTTVGDSGSSSQPVTAPASRSW